MGRVLKTTIKQISDYWIENNNISELDLNFDWLYSETHCWNCGDDKQSKSNPKKIRLERCHIIPHSLGGEDKPKNYVLLCKDCHKEAPDCTKPKYMWDWIKSNKMSIGLSNSYRTQKALILFKKRRGYSFFNISHNFNAEEVSNKLKDVMSTMTQTHFNKFSIETIYVQFCETYDYFYNKLD